MKLGGLVADQIWSVTNFLVSDQIHGCKSKRIGVNVSPYMIRYWRFPNNYGETEASAAGTSGRRPSTS